jgi:peptide/nickel transport system permease protein
MSSLLRIAQSLFYPRKLATRHPQLDGEAPARAGSRLRLRHITSNYPLMIGGLIVLGLFLMVLFGPLWAPVNPYIAGQHVVPHLDPETGVWIDPPLNPSVQYPLGTDEYGNDILSMLLYGARNTLIAASFITMVRVILGLVLGSLAGWNENKAIDRFVMGSSGVIVAVPMLISSMILIYALDIRRGLPVFIVALSLIGWTEIAQYIRSEILIIRKMPYIEGARAVGSNERSMVVRHVLPNLLPQLLVLIFLEFAAVLLLLGALAFIGVFIGGGTSTVAGDDTITLSTQVVADVPEWGAMLAGGYRWFTSKPFIVFPPAVAFFIAIIGFNTFGEGLRRLIEKTNLNTSFLLKKRMLLVIIGITAATIYIISNTGPAPWFAKMANAFSGSDAYLHTQTLAQMNGRAPNQASSAEAAAYIAQKFEEYGLQPGWRHLEYTYPMSMTLTGPLAQPQLELLDGDGRLLQSFTHQLEFSYLIEGHGGSGDVDLPLTFVGFAAEASPPDAEVFGTSWEAYRGLDLRDRIVLLLEGNAPAEFPVEALVRGARGVLWISEDDSNIRSQTQFAYEDRDYMRFPQLPVYRISSSTADTILGAMGVPLVDLFAAEAVEVTKTPASQSGPGWFTRELNGATVHMALDLSEAQEVAVPTILGYLPGSDLNLAGELVVVYAHYDGLGIDPDGTIYPAVNHNASGIGVMLEVARLWQEEELDPRRPVLFVAWGAGTLDNPGAQAFFDSAESFRHLPTTEELQPRAVFQLDYAGAGDDELFIHPGSNSILRELISESAAEVGVLLAESGEGSGGKAFDTHAPWVYLAWDNGSLSPEQDTFNRIEADKLRPYGELLALSLAKVVRQSRY